MMARGEVALIVTSTAIAAGLPGHFVIMTVLLILVSSILTPILLKVLYGDKNSPKGPAKEDEVKPVASEQTVAEQTQG
jgi:Kef-type K+ transport system membrane component KefB